MAISRLYIYSGERYTGNDFEKVDAYNDPGTESNADHIVTGNRAYNITSLESAIHYTETPVVGFRVGYFMKMESFYSSSIVSFIGVQEEDDFQDNYNIHLAWDVAADQFKLIRPAASGVDSVVVGTPTTKFKRLLEYKHISAWLYFHQTAGRMVLWCDGVKLVDYTGDTRPSKSTGGLSYATTAQRLVATGKVYEQGSGWERVYIDDLYYDSVEGADTPVISPALRFLRAGPNANGQDSSFTRSTGSSNYANVDDRPGDGDSTYNYASAANLRDTFNMEDITALGGYSIAAVNVYAMAKRTDPGTDSQLSLHLYDGVYSDSPDIALDTEYNNKLRRYRFTTTPGGAAFTQTNLNSLQAGYRSRGTF